MLRLALAAVYVDQIPHGLEEIEGNAGRKNKGKRQRLQGKLSGSDHFVKPGNQRIACLIEDQYHYQRKNTAKKAEFSSGEGGSCFQSDSQSVGEYGREEKQQPVTRVQIHVESIAGDQQEYPAVSVRNQVIQNKYDR